MREIVELEDLISEYLDKKGRVHRMPVVLLHQGIQAVKSHVDLLYQQIKSSDKKLEVNVQEQRLLTENLEQQVISLNSELQTAKQGLVELEAVPGRVKFKELRRQKHLFDQRKRQVEQLKENYAKIAENAVSFEKWKIVMLEKECEYIRVIDDLKELLRKSEKVSGAISVLFRGDCQI